MNRLAIFFLALLVCAYSLHAQDMNSLSGRKAPGFKLEDLDGNLIDSKSLTGKGPLLLSFWATYCKPCMEEMKELQIIYDELKDKGLQYYAISIDNEKTASKVKPLVKSKKFSFPVLLDPASEAAHKFYVNNPPSTVLIDKKGVIVYYHNTYKKGDENVLRKKIEELLK